MCGCVWAFHAWLNTQQEERQMETERWKYLSRFKGIMRIERDRLHVRTWVINKKTCFTFITSHSSTVTPDWAENTRPFLCVLKWHLHDINPTGCALNLITDVLCVGLSNLDHCYVPQCKKTKTSEALWALFVAVLQTWLNYYAEDPMWLVQHTGGWCKLFLRQL